MQKPNLALATNKDLQQYITNDIVSTVKNANELVSNAVGLLKQKSYVEFSSILSDQDAGVCYTSLVVDRLIGKFSYGKTTVDTKAAAFTTYKNFEETHCKDISECYEYWGPSKGHLAIRRAGALLQGWFRNFDFDIKETMIEFTPGETFTSSKGDVSVLAKLADLKHWTTSWNCLDLTCALIYNNAGLKKAAREHIGKLDREYRRSLYVRFRKSANVGFEVFKRLLIDKVLTIVDGARASSVPKNIKTDRFINIEPMFSMMLQRIVAATFRKVLKRAGNDLGKHRTASGVLVLSAQALHGLLIKFADMATIDFKNASDSVILHVVAQVFPRSVSDVLIKTRSQYIDFGNEELVEPYKLSSMGNGFTFEVMTMLLYAIAKTMTPYCKVYGDDVILPNAFAAPFIDACKLIGFNVNEKKSFIYSRFRESCGKFYHDDAGYFTSFDFRVNTSVSDVITTVNKLFMILNNINTGLLDKELVKILTDLHTKLMLLLPVLQKGSVPITRDMQMQNLSLYAFDAAARRKHKNNAAVRSIRAAYLDAVTDPNLLRELETAVILLVPRWKPLARTIKVNKIFEQLAAMHALRVTDPTIKGMGKWVLIPCFITETGSILEVNKCEDSLASTFSSRRPEFDHGGASCA